jgi:hypothetical protein
MPVLLCRPASEDRRRRGEWPDMPHARMPLASLQGSDPIILVLEFYVVIVCTKKKQVQIKVILRSHEITNIGVKKYTNTGRIT